MKPRTENLRIRVTPEEKTVIEHVAKQAGHTTSAWLRALALRVAKEKR